MQIAPELFMEKLQRGEKLPRLLAVFGEEAYYRSEIARLLPEYLFAGVDAANREITVLEKDAGLAELEQAVNSYPFFCGQALVIIREGQLTAQAGSRALVRLLTDVPGYCTVFLDLLKLDGRSALYKHVLEQGLLCKCEPLRAEHLAPWLNRRAAALGGRLDAGAQAAILEYLAPVEKKVPLQLLSRELEKLALYAGERRQWTQEDVVAVFSPLPEVADFALSDALLAHQLTETLRLLAGERRKRGGNFRLLLGQLIFQLRRLLRLRELLRQGMDRGQISAALKLHPYYAGKLLAQCKKFPEARLREALVQLERLSIAVARGGRQYQRLEEIIVELLS